MNMKRKLKHINKLSETLLTEIFNEHGLEPEGSLYDQLNLLVKNVADITIKVLHGLPVSLSEYRAKPNEYDPINPINQ